jgi:Ca-activated chloride channel family protein
LFTGALQLEGGTEKTVSRVILLSDGKANRGERDLSIIEGQCREWLGRGVSTTTVGLGRGSNEDLMIGMARAGGGQNQYGETAADLNDSFEEELALLQTMHLRQIGLKLLPAAGVIMEMLSPALQLVDRSWRMTDFAWGAEAWVAVRLHLSPGTAGQTRDLLAASVSGTALDGTAMQAHAPVLQLPVLDAAALEALHRNETAYTRLEELAFTNASEHLRQLANEGDETHISESVMPSFLRKKVSEGKGKKQD